jgi:F-type H+-transporting ATPase subunit c
VCCHSGCNSQRQPGFHAAIARQPEIESKARTTFFLTVGLVEAMYFINLVFAVLFVVVFQKTA